MDYSKQVYNKQYEKWMPWIEDQYLYYFGKDNKASYATKGASDHVFTRFHCQSTRGARPDHEIIDQLSKSKVTGVEQVDNLQDGVNNLAAGQVGKGGLLQPLGDAASKEGVNRMERGGKDDKGSYGGPAGGITDGAVDSAKSGGSSLTSGVKSAGGYIGSFSPWGGKKEEKK